jgi:hypothetical protein
LGKRHERRAEQALHDPEQHDLHQGLREAAQDQGEGKPCNRDEKKTHQSKPSSQEAGGRRHNRRRDDIRRQHPGAWQEHLQGDVLELDAEVQGGYVACAVFESVGDCASVQVVGGLSADEAAALARKGLRAFVISGNLGLPDAKPRYGLPGNEIERRIRDFIDQVSAAG